MRWPKKKPNATPATPERMESVADLLANTMRATLYRANDYQEHLAKVDAVRQADRVVTIEVLETPSGKFAGRPYARVWVNGGIVGELPAQHRGRNEQVYRAVLDEGKCRATVVTMYDSAEGRYVAIGAFYVND